MIGQTVGSYRIIGVLGRGGIGVVYTAEHNLIGRRAAVKVLNSHYSQDEPMVQRFFNEARASSLIKHPGIVDVFDFGYTEDGAAYIIMELLEGESLAARLARDHKLAPPLALAILRRLATALAAAHRNGMIHRDLKPDNVFLAAHPEDALGFEVKVLDFGVAKLMRPGRAARVTESGALLGTPLYMSPEQCRGAENVDRRSDVYSLGCIAYEMLTGRPPFEPVAAMDVFNAHVSEKPAPLRTHEPDLSPTLDDFVLSMLAKKPGDRPQTMEEVASAFAAIEGGRELPISVATTTARRRGRPRSSRLPIVLAALAFALAGGLVAAAKLRNRSQAPVAAPPAAAPAPPAPVVQPMPRVHHDIASEPPGAEVVTEAGTVLGKTPLARELEPSDTMAVYVVRMQGYRDARLALAGGRDDRADIVLQPFADAAPRPARRRPREEAPIADGPVDPFK
jgi:hypothetical protein